MDRLLKKNKRDIIIYSTFKQGNHMGNLATLFVIILIFSQELTSFEHPGILQTLRSIHDPLLAHDKIMNFGERDGKISSVTIVSLFNRAQALKNYSALIHISNSYQICKSTNTKNIPPYPIGCVAHTTLANLITILAETSPFKHTKHAFDYATFKNHAQQIIKNAVEEKNLFAFLAFILMKNATLTGIEATDKLFIQITELLVAARQKIELPISQALWNTIASFTKAKCLDAINAEAIYSYILLKTCIQDNKLSAASSFYPACILGNLQKYTNFEELHFWIGAMLFNSGQCKEVKAEGFRLLEKSKMMLFTCDNKKDLKSLKSVFGQKRFNDFLNTITFTTYALNHTIQLYEPGLMINASEIETWERFLQNQIIQYPPYDLAFYSTFLDFNSSQLYRYTDGISLKAIQQESSLPLLAVYRKQKDNMIEEEELIAAITPKTFEDYGFKVSTIITDETITQDVKNLLNFYEAWFSRNPSVLFEQQDVWHFTSMFNKAKEFFHKLDNKSSPPKPRITRQSSDPFPISPQQGRLKPKEIILKKFTVSFHEEILSSGSDEEPQNENK